MEKKVRRLQEEGARWVLVLCEILKGGALAGVAALLGLALCAALISGGVLRENWIPGMGPAVCALGSLLGGLYAVGRIHSRTLPTGLGVGAVLFLLLLAAGLMAFPGAGPGRGTAGVLCASLCGGALAGILGGLTGKKRRR